ncbi:hemin-degrading factor [Solimonas sp. C16B3]|uniref:Hemin-degrading factor n=2 Tax=Solimonas marina TaxID=2714601 RepID=A0A969W7Y2_9GAMM|nr:hemin-degrading factor [Solimonas marina]
MDAVADDTVVPLTLPARWSQLRARQPRLRIRDAAAQLGVSEMELLLTEAPETVVRLDAAPSAIMKSVESLGRVMTLARNETVVHETKGPLRDLDVSANGRIGLCLGEIDLRLFFDQWAYAYAVLQADAGGRDSLQFFHAAGGALLKVYRFDDEARPAWTSLVARLRAAEQRPALELVAPVTPPPRRAPLDRQALLADWATITDLHQFNGMLRRHDVDRLSALEAAGRDWAQPLPAGTLERALRLAAERGQSIMAFVGNAGVVQIYTGRVQRLLATGPWFNVMDEHFNLHANAAAIASSWIVRRPSEDGDIHSLEFFDADGTLVLTLFGERKPGIPEQTGWRELLGALDA